MSIDPEAQDIKTLWQHQATEAKPMDIERIRKNAAYFQRTIRWRNVREYVVAAFVAFTFGQRLFSGGSPVLRLGDFLVILGVAFVCWQLHRRGSAEVCPPGASAAEFFRFHRGQLMRQRAALRSVFVWYIGPFLPGLLVIFAGRMMQHPHAWTPAVGLAVVGVIVVGVWYVNQLAADGMAKQISEIDRVLAEYE